MDPLENTKKKIKIKLFIAYPRQLHNIFMREGRNNPPSPGEPQ